VAKIASTRWRSEKSSTDFERVGADEWDVHAERAGVEEVGGAR